MARSVKVKKLGDLNNLLSQLEGRVLNSTTEIKKSIALAVSREVADINPEDTGYSEYNWRVDGTKIKDTKGAYIPRSTFYAQMFQANVTKSINKNTVSSLSAGVGVPIYVGNAVDYLNKMPYSSEEWVPLGIDKAVRGVDIIIDNILRKI
jgi:hypothetical protein